MAGAPSALPDAEQALQLVLRVIGAVLDVLPSSLAADARFNSLGLTSLQAARVTAELSRSLGRALPATLMWDYPTAQRLARFLSGAASSDDSRRMANAARVAEPVAIVSAACRLPGADSPEAFWQLLAEGRDVVGPMPSDRFAVEQLYDPDPLAPGRMATRQGGFLDRVDGFDAAFFGIAPVEALEMDPQQRLILELAWEALERAGCRPSSLNGSRTGVFVGAMWSDYGQLFGGLDAIAAHSATGRDPGIIANRVSYQLGLTGPSLTVDTACSSALTAVHLAVRALRAGDCDAALAGGVNLILTPDSSVAMTKFGGMAPDGRSKTFDASADGYVRGEGAGLVWLKSLSRALADGDRIIALIRGSAINNDGPSNGLTAPNPDAQRAVLRDAWADAGVPPGEVDYVEAHGTGTLLGDPIEAGALGAVLGNAEGRRSPLIIASAKTNIGHLEAAAGVAGLIKTALALQQAAIPPGLHFNQPNPHIDFTGWNLRVPTSLEPWPAHDHPRRAGVSAFGFGGSNAHVALEAWVPSPLPVVPAGKTTVPSRPHLVYVLSGNGAVWAGVGRDLLAAEPAFYRAVARCDAAFARLTTQWSVLDLMAGGADADAMSGQCLSFAVQIGLAAVLAERGWHPDIVLGHSVGEAAAAFLAGALSLTDAARVVFHHGMVTADLPVPGAMAQALADPETVTRLLADLPDVEIAGYNAPQAVAVGGPAKAVQQALDVLHGAGVVAAAVRVNIAYHTSAMDEPRVRLESLLADMVPQSGNGVRFWSSVDAGPLDAGDLTAAYWGRNLRHPVCFDQALASLPPDAVIVELSAHSILSRSIQDGVMARGRPGPVLESLKREHLAAGTLGALFSGLVDAGLSPRPDTAPASFQLPLSARSETALRALAGRYISALENLGDAPEYLAAFCAAALAERDRLDCRALVAGPDRAALIVALRAIQVGGSAGGCDADWPQEDGPHLRQPIALPVYPFQHSRYWPAMAESGVAGQHRADWQLSLLWQDVGDLPLITLDLAAPDKLVDDLILAKLPLAVSAAALDQLAAAYAGAGLATAPEPSADNRFATRRLAGLRRLAATVTGLDINIQELAARLAAERPDAAAELSLINAVGSNVADILEGRRDPLDLLFSDSGSAVLEALYQRSPFASALAVRIAAAFAAFASSTDAHLRVVEVGAGTGGTTAHLLPILPAGSSYHFTDLSAAFFDRAIARFADHPGLRCAVLDIECPPVEQGIGGGFDVAVAVNALHATRDLPATLRHVRSLLRPGGVLLLGEITGSPGWLDLVFGMLDGWHRHSDGLRGDSALLGPDGWRAALAGAGFDAVGVAADGDRQSLIIARAGADTRLVIGLGQDLPATGRWEETLVVDDGSADLFDGDENGLAAACSRLESLLDDPRFGRVQLGLVAGDAAIRQTALRAFATSRGIADPLRWGGVLYAGSQTGLEQLASTRPVAEDGLRLTGQGRIERLRLQPADAVGAEPGVPVRADRRYLIAGGHGALGLAFARWLADRGARQIDLISRSAPSGAAGNVIDQLRARGLVVRSVAVDLADRAGLAAALADLARDGLPLAGVIHAAGNADSDPLRALPPKLSGARNLDQLTRDPLVEVFFAFSSAAVSWGAKGKAVYAAANGALDAVVAERRHAGFPALSIAWGRFALRGLLSEAEDTALADMGMQAMDPALAFATAWPLTAGMGRDAVIAAIDWPQFRAVNEARYPRALFEGLSTAGATPVFPVPARPGRVPGGDLRATVTALVADTLGFAGGEDIPADRGLFQLGLDSLLAVRLRGRLEQALGRSIPAAALFSYPTIDALTGWLAGEQATQSPTPSACPAATGDQDIAVIGMACRFPGGADDPESFARLLLDGIDAVTEVPAERWDWRDWFSTDPDEAGRMVSRWGGFLRDIDRFDAGFFGIPPTEAAFMDPQQRLLLEMAWQAVERAGIDPKSLNGTRAGVFVGITGSDYARLVQRGAPERLEGQAITGQPANTAAGRIAFTMGLTGPVLSLDTACSSSLAALHLACRALIGGECEMALAGGVNLILSPETSVILSRAGMLSPTGRCRAFDQGADGFVRAEGVGMVLLKPLAAAQAAGDRVLAVVRGSAMNHDGRSSGFTVPNGSAQEAVIRAALTAAGVAPHQVSYVEAHGTGTSLGDPIEAHALAAALGEGRTTPLLVGSVKTNIGHAESAAGVAGFIKTVLALGTGQLPASLHFTGLNPHIALGDGVIAPVTTAQPFPRLDGRRIAGVSAFGASGTNVHMLLEAAPRPVRAHSASINAPQLAFMFTGQGAQQIGMASSLLGLSPAFGAVFDRCDAVAMPILGISLRDVIAPDSGHDLNRTALAQPALFAVGCALAAFWRSVGVTPAAVLGHSVGEYMAAVEAGVLALEDAMALIARRGALMQALPPGGGMLAVTADAAALTEMLADEPTLSLAALNGPANSVVAGPLGALDRLEQRLKPAGLRTRLLPVSHAFHSALLDPMLDGLAAAAADIPHNPPQLPLLSNVTGAVADQIDPAYWCRHARQPVRFADGVRSAAALGCTLFLEIGPRPVLSSLAAAVLGGAGQAVAGLGSRDDDPSSLMDAISQLRRAGLAVDLDAVAFELSGGQPLAGLPTTAFHRKRHWLDWAVPQRPASGSAVPVPNDCLYQLAWDVCAPSGRGGTLSGAWQLLGDPQAAQALIADWRALGIDAHAEDADTPQAGWAGRLWLAESGDPVAGLGRVNALAGSGPGPLWLVTRNAHQIDGADPAVDARMAAFWGLGRVLALQHPDHWGGLIDLSGPVVDGRGLAACLARGDGEDQLAIRAGLVRAARLVSASLSPSPALPIRPDHRYVITGGLGGLGQALALWLVQGGARHLVLLGRRDANLPDQLVALRQLGCSVSYHAVDVADAGAMDRLAGQLAGGPPVAGIFHAAGVKDGGFATTLPVKLAGAEQLARISAGWPVEMFVLFGSAAAVWGDRDLASYAAANAALAGFAFAARHRGLPVTVVDWARFDVRGMLDDTGAVAFDRLGLRPIPCERAYELMLAVVSGGQTQAIVADVDWPKFRSLYELRRPSPLLRRLAVASDNSPVRPPVSPARSRADWVRLLCRMVAEVAGIADAGELPTDRGFFDIGLDSFGVVELRRRIEREHGIRLPTSALFDYPSVNQLALHLASDSTVPDLPPVLADDSRITDTGAVAIVGVGMRLPGGISDLDSLTRALLDGFDAVGPAPLMRRADLGDWQAAGQAGWLDRVDGFDADFFGISPREAAQIDPQHRLLLTTAWEALEQAGWSVPDMSGSATGVYVGITGTEYADLARAAGRRDAHAVGGQFLNAAAGRLSHALGLRGPALAVDTACSSSALAIHLASRAILAGDCETALAGGVNLILTPETSALLGRARMLAADGRCKTFDAAADGYVRAEACSLVVLKRLDRALADGDRVLAVLRGSATNHDGVSGGFTVPSGAAQQLVIRAALADAQVDAAAISYVEAHGTGTSLGDPIELHALDAVFGDQAPERGGPLLVGSIKTNIGHAEAAAGVAGLLKLIAGLRAGTVPAHCHLTRLNPHIQVTPDRVAISTTRQPWPIVQGRRLAGLSAFGASGTNVHLVVEGWQQPDPPAATGHHLPAILALSARRAEDLDGLARHVLREGDFDLVCRESVRARSALPWRLALVADSSDGALTALSGAPRGRAGQPRVAFLFTGQGAQKPGMARSLYQQEPVFRAAIDAVADAMAGHLPMPLTALLFGHADGQDQVDLTPTGRAQPALFALGYGLAALWRSWGVEPAAVLGHSAGEIAACCVAGAISLADGARFVVERGRLMDSLPAGGAMAAVAASEPALLAALGGALPTGLEIAAVNGPDRLTLTGPAGVIDQALSRLAHSEISARRLAVSHAFHSAQVDPILDELAAAAASVISREASIPVACNLDGQPRYRFDAAYWRAQARAPVQFSAGLATLADLGCDALIEIGPDATLIAMARRQLGNAVCCGASLQPGLPDRHSLLATAAALWVQGGTIAWQGIQPSRPVDTKALPPYPLREQRHWLPARPLFADRLAVPGVRAAMHGQRLNPSDLPGLDESGHLVHAGLHLAFFAAVLEGGGTAVLEDGAFLRPLLLDAPQDLRITVADDGLCTLYGRAVDADDAVDWTRHCEVRRGDAPPVTRPVLDAGAVMATCPDPVDGDILYGDLARRGFRLGARLQRIERIWRGQNRALARLLPVLPGERLAFGLPASLIEVCAQLPAAVYPQASGAFMLAAFDRISLYGGPVGDAVWLHAETALDERAGILRADVTLADGAGQVLLRLEGALLRRLATGSTTDSRLPWVGQITTAAVSLPAATSIAALPCRIVCEDAGTEQFAVFAGLVHDPAAALSVLLPGGTEAATLARAAGLAGELVGQGSARLLLVARGMAGAGLAGIAQAIRAEYPSLDCRTAEVEGPGDLAQAVAAAVAGHDEPDLIWRNGCCLAPRLTPAPQQPGFAEPARLVVARPGFVDGLDWQRLDQGEEALAEGLLPGQLLVRVVAAAPNFRDVLALYGQGPGAGQPLGADCAGQVVAAGKGVSFQPGDRVVAWCPGGGALASHLVAEQRHVRAIPATLSMAAAAAQPVALMTALYGLADHASLRAGETVLVIGAGGGVGLAVIAVARHLGARVLAAVSPAKAADVAALAVPVIADSRRPDWADATLAATGGHGVDVVIGAFDEAALPQAMACLAPAGRLVNLARGADADGIDLDRLCLQQPEQFARLFDQAMALAAGGQLVPHQAVPARDMVSAFRRLSSGSVFGRISLLLMDEPPLPVAAGGWVIAGAAGAVGQALVRHLAAQGVSAFLLLDRSPCPADLLDDLAHSGAAVVTAQLDLADDAALTAALAQAEQTLPPLHNIVLSAALTDDAPLADLDTASFARVLAPKLAGAMVLDRLTRHLPIQRFIGFSSIVASLPSSRQAAYAAANAALDRVILARLADGLPALSIQWGPWALGIGAAMGQRTQAVWRAWGVEAMATGPALAAFDRWNDATGRLAVLDIDWVRYGDALGTVPPLLSGVIRTSAPVIRPAVIVGTAPAAPVPVADGGVPGLVAGAVAEILGLSGPASLDQQRPFAEMGMDSLMSADLATLLSRRLGRRLSGTLAYNFPTTAALTAHLAAQEPEAAPQAKPVPVTPGRAPAPAMPGKTQVAVIGLGCRFPGIDGAEAFQSFLMQGGTTVREVPGMRGYGALAPAALARGGFFDDLAQFDPAPFGLSEEEALAMDPHQRLLLETTWSALADAGLQAGDLAGSRTGVYVGLGAQNGDFAGWLMAAADHLPTAVAAAIIPGSFHSLMPGRISYLLDVRGPSQVIDAACASALVAVDQACQALQRGEIDLAVVGAVNLALSPRVAQAVHRNGLWSVSGACRPFDAAADGFVRGEGAGVIILRRSSDIAADQPAPWAVIHGTAVGHDGRSNGLTAPNGPAQEAVLRLALAEAGVTADQVGYVEAHATGTRLGDAIEAQALAAVYGTPDRTTAPLVIGGVKGNLGHLEAAAGMAGLIKTILALSHRHIPPQAGFASLNPDIDGDVVVTQGGSWPQSAPLAGVSAFGMSGVNAHLILGAATGNAPHAGRPDAPLFHRRRIWLDGIGPQPGPLTAPLPVLAEPPADMLARLDWLVAPLVVRHATPSVQVAGNGELAAGLLSGLRAAGVTVIDRDGLPPVPAIILLPVGVDADETALCHLLDLVQELVRSQRRDLRLWIVGHGAAGTSSIAAAASALGRSIALEHAELGCRRIDLDGDLPDVSAALLAELSAGEDAWQAEEWVRWGASGRAVARVKPLVPDRAPAFRVRDGACCLVTGAHGGIGRALTGWLIARGARDVMLLSRRSVGDLSGDPQLAQWAAAGVRLRLVQADVADEDAVRRALAGLDGDGVPLAAVFHAAGSTADALLAHQDWAGFAGTLRPKRDGAMVLDRVTRGRGLDAFVLFSSITALIGLIGTGVYAAANASLSAVARQRRAAGEPATSILWGTWIGSGMVEGADAEQAQRWRDHGLIPFSPADGLAALDCLINPAAPVEAIAARIDWSRLARWAREGGSGASLYDRVVRAMDMAPLPSVVPGIPHDLAGMTGLVRGAVAHVLGLDGDDPVLDQPFGALGLGSLAAVDLRNRLSASLGIPVPATLAFNHPSVLASASFLLGRLAAGNPALSATNPAVRPMAPSGLSPVPSAEPAAAYPAGNSVTTTADAIAALSDDEAEERLAALLAVFEPK